MIGLFVIHLLNSLQSSKKIVYFALSMQLLVFFLLYKLSIIIQGILYFLLVDSYLSNIFLLIEYYIGRLRKNWKILIL